MSEKRPLPPAEVARASCSPAMAFKLANKHFVQRNNLDYASFGWASFVSLDNLEVRAQARASRHFVLYLAL